MGCDIHIYLESYDSLKKQWFFLEKLGEPLSWRSYAYFGILADVRNYSTIAPIAEPRGLPGDLSEGIARCHENDGEVHSESWYLVDELLAFDWDEPCEDLRVTRDNDGGCTCEPGEGVMTTYRAMFGEDRILALEELLERRGSALRLVFWFSC